MNSPEPRIAFLGTGLMGYPMAGRLLDEGYRVSAWNRTRSKALGLTDRGATVVDRVEEAVADADVVVLMLADAPAIRNTLLSEAVTDRLRGRTVIQMGTIGAGESRQLSGELDDEGVDYLEAPVLGSIGEAQNGTLIVMVGSDEVQFERWSPVLRVFGPDPRRIGAIGDAATLKLAMNQLIASITAAYALSLGLIRRADIDLDAYVDTVRASALYAPTFDKKLPRMLAGDFDRANFPVRHLLKDVRLILAEAALLGLATPALEGVRAILETAVRTGHGDADYSALSAAVDPVIE